MRAQLEVPPLPHDAEAWKLFVFRKSRESLPARRLLAELRAEIQSVACGSGSVIDALVRAGEIETGLADAGSPAAAAVAAVVDRLASMACGRQEPAVSELQPLDIDVPAEICCSHPEGFSYYGLNPLDFAELTRLVRNDLRQTVAVIGIRSVGSTLSAVVAAMLRALGTRAERITVRPEGEPYHRRTTFSPEQEHWIRASLGKESDFVVVDEGPGFSGSTFLSVACALVEAGVPCSRIVLMGSRPFAIHRTSATLPADWNCFRLYTINYASHAPAGAARCLGDGAWRQLLYSDATEWPACWVEQERIKHLSADGRIFFKFEGFGRFGQLAREQTAILVQEKYSPLSLGCDQGYAAYERIRGRPLTARDLCRDLLVRMAAYCAFRVQSFQAPGCDLSLLKSMARVNLEIEFGAGRQDFDLEILLERPVYPDCRMLPHEWLLASDGRILKTDAVGHGDGHQFPGPTDIAWDLAGAIVEWNLTAAETAFFLDQYRRRSRDDAARRLGPYLLLYTTLRTAQCRMAAASLAQRREGRYLYRQYLTYSRLTKVLLDHRPVYN
jgi:hypothetical protein